MKTANLISPITNNPLRKKFINTVCIPRGRKSCRDCMFLNETVCTSSAATKKDYKEALKRFREVSK